MIYVSQEQLDQVEYLIQQSQQGNHVLFDADSIRETFRTHSERFSEEKAYAVEHHIEKLLQQPTLFSKKQYLEQLDDETYRLVLRTYFNIVENSVYEKLEDTH